tara:strand:- start:1679 stop:2170 length:492 start_codon:yes stop_codon:yes gene_type:complete
MYEQGSPIQISVTNSQSRFKLKLSSLCTVIALCCLIAGCSKESGPQTFPVKGKVIYDGKPLNNGTVRYAPIDAAKGRAAIGEISKEGGFTLSTYKPGDGVLPGKYNISITAFVIPEDATEKQIQKQYFNKPAIPKKYFDVKTSGLNDSVDDSHSGYTEFVLTN